jgi:peptide/nickel transport system substrate-binding protein
MNAIRNPGLGVLAFVVLVACAPAPAPNGGGASTTGTERRPGGGTLTMLARYEPVALASKELRTAGAGTSSTRRLFNAELDFVDGRAVDRPYLADALPELNTDSWRVLPDGRMETSYRLRPNLAWHDGTPLSAEDFVFAYRVYATPELGVAGSKPIHLMEEVVAMDRNSLVIRWRTLTAEARALGPGFQALPRHLLEQSYEEREATAFLEQPFWNVQYVGLGPYRLQRWELGSLLEAIAFEHHALGRPKIDRVVVRFIADENTALTTILAGEGDYATGRSLRFEHAMVLKRRWDPTGGGSVLLTPDTSRFTSFQFRPEVVTPRALLDLNVRKALAHAIDKSALNDGIFDGQPIASVDDTFIHRYHRNDYVPDVERAVRELDRAITKYPYDTRRSEQLMAEAEFVRRDGAWTSPGGERVNMEVWSDQGPQYERELAIVAETWQRAGFEVRQYILPAAQLRDAQVRNTFPAIYTTSSSRLESLYGQSAGSPANRWAGNNRGGWSNPEYDRNFEAFGTTLDVSERIRLVVDMMRIVSDNVPSWVLYHNPSVSAHYAKLRGPDSASLASDVWNIHEWELR